MSTFLLDANVLIALTVAEHQHHDRSSDWIAEVGKFAVCPIVEGALIRFLVRLGEAANTAQAVLSGVQSHPRYEFWSDSISYIDAELATVHGHRHVTDAYLVSLARSRGGVLATLDQSLTHRHPDHSLLLPGK